ncbi:MAG: CPBP family intramembrane glutamic endopeptidase [Pseudomonadota bacterium]
MTEKNSTFPNGRDAVLLLVALFLLEYMLGMLLDAANTVLDMEELALSGIVTLLANGAILTAVMHHKGLTFRQLFHSGSASAKATLLVLAPAIAMTVPALIFIVSMLVTVVARLFPLSAADEAMFNEMGSGNFVSLVLACILSPVLEEMLFRGVILRSFLQQYARWPAIMGTAVLFGVAHMNIYQFGVGIVLGLYLGWLYERTRSLLPCIALHAAYNTTLMTIAQADSAAGFSDAFLASALVFGIAGTFMLRRMLVPQKVAGR